MPEDYVVRQGDCISSIAYKKGHFWQTIWDHPQNARLKSERKDPNILKEGDIVHIPDLRPKEVSGATDRRHKFVFKSVPAKLRLQLLRQERSESAGDSTQASNDFSVIEETPQPAAEMHDRPRANVPFVLDIDGRLTRGKTDGEGRLEVVLPPDAREGFLIVEPGTPRETVVRLALGTMDPITEIAGLRKRLNNLGFCCCEADDMTPDLESALRAFQEKYGLQVTGQPDQATRDKLQQIHGS